MVIDTVSHSIEILKGSHDRLEDRSCHKDLRQFRKGIVYAVIDGISRHKQGGLAAGLTRAFFSQHYIQNGLQLGQSLADFMESTIRATNWEISMYAQRGPNYSGMGATLSTLLLDGNKAYIFNVGDSRVYKLTPEVVQLTQDHHDAEGRLTQYIGIGDGLEIQTAETDITDGDQFLLCTDGLDLRLEEIKRVTRSISDLSQANKELVRLAKRRSNDDITSILLEIECA